MHHERVADEDHMGRCGMLSVYESCCSGTFVTENRGHFSPGCVAYGCSKAAPMDSELKDDILQRWNGIYGWPVSKINLSHPWERYHKGLDSVTKV